MPYTIVNESPGAFAEFEGELSDCVMRQLEAGEIHQVANMPNRKQNLE